MKSKSLSHFLMFLYVQIIDAVDYGMTKLADLMIKHVLVPAISNISVAVSVEALEKSGPQYPISILRVTPTEELQVSGS